MNAIAGALWGIAAAICFGASSGISLGPARKWGEARTMLVSRAYSGPIAALIALVASLAAGFDSFLAPARNAMSGALYGPYIRTSAQTVVIAVAVVVFCGYAALMLLFRSLRPRNGSPTGAAAIATTSVLVTVFLECILGVQRLVGYWNYVGVAFVVGGAIVVAVANAHSGGTVGGGLRWVRDALWSAVLYGAVFFSFGFLVASLGEFLTLATTELGLLAVAGVHALVRHDDFRPLGAGDNLAKDGSEVEPRWALKIYAPLAGVTVATAGLFFNLSVNAFHSAALPTTIATARPAFTAAVVWCAYVRPSEGVADAARRRRRWTALGVGLIIAGLVLATT